MLEIEENTPSKLNSPLCVLLREKLGSSAHEALNSIYAKGKTYIASFAPTVFEAHGQGDLTATAIIDSNASAVASRISTALSLYGSLDEIVCAGGLFNSPLFYDLLAQKTNIPLSLLTDPPVLGACRRAMKI